MTETPEPETVAPGRRWLLPVALLVVLAALLATAAVLQSRRGNDVDPGMVVAAKQEAENFFSLDHRHAEADVEKVLALATGAFKKEYAARKDEVIDGVISKKLVVTATIPDDGAAVELVDGDRGQVLVAVDVSTGTSAGAAPTENRYRTRIVLTRVDGRWLVSGLNQVG